MCRLLYVRAMDAVDVRSHLKRFALTARNSTEDQSHGWGCAWIESGDWAFYHNLKPVWEDDFARFADSRIFLAHARSAYRNEGIEIENNMPFFDGRKVFIFNGELQGVRINEQGRIGAEKVFNFVKRFDHGDTLSAIRQGVQLLVKKSQYVRAMNFIIAEQGQAWISTAFSENSGYFQMHQKYSEGEHVISSAPYENESGWVPIENRTIRIID